MRPGSRRRARRDRPQDPRAEALRTILQGGPRSHVWRRRRGGEARRPRGDSVTIETLVTRFEQFYDESEVICGAAAEAFAARDYAELGRLVDESHRLTVEKLGNTIPETAWLPGGRGLAAAGGSDAAAAAAGGGGRVRALAASAFGAGFGGSCWALVRAAPPPSAQWRDAYGAAFPAAAGAGLAREFFVMSPAPGARAVSWFRVVNFPRRSYATAHSMHRELEQSAPRLTCPSRTCRRCFPSPTASCRARGRCAAAPRSARR